MAQSKVHGSSLVIFHSYRSLPEGDCYVEWNIKILLDAHIPLQVYEYSAVKLPLVDEHIY